jgi:riboflavin synthase
MGENGFTAPARRLDGRLESSPRGVESRAEAVVFTGIIEEVGIVLEAGEGTLRVRAPHVLSDAQLGDSIAVNGVDLTVAEIDGDAFFANLMPETYRRSNLGDLRPDDAVNLERSVRPSDRLSGHIVRGVVEGVGTVDSFTAEGEAIIARFRAPRELLRLMVVKGPVAIDGISLTIVAKDADSFSVSLVQYTQEHTNLRRRQAGDHVNLETDILARYVDQLLAARAAEGESSA